MSNTPDAEAEVAMQFESVRAVQSALVDVLPKEIRSLVASYGACPAFDELLDNREWLNRILALIPGAVPDIRGGGAGVLLRFECTVRRRFRLPPNVRVPYSTRLAAPAFVDGFSVESHTRIAARIDFDRRYYLVPPMLARDSAFHTPPLPAPPAEAVFECWKREHEIVLAILRLLVRDHPSSGEHVRVRRVDCAQHVFFLLGTCDEQLALPLLAAGAACPLVFHFWSDDVDPTLA